MSTNQPAVGQIVHYVSYGTPGGEYTSQCRAAVITEVSSWVDSYWGQPNLGLAVVNPTGVFFRTLNDGGCVYDEGDADGDGDVGYQGGTWHWPERVNSGTSNRD